MFNIFLPKDNVFIVPLSLYGVCIGVYHSIGNIEYKIRYILNEEIKECYFYGFELSKVKEKV